MNDLIDRIIATTKGMSMVVVRLFEPSWFSIDEKSLYRSKMMKEYNLTEEDFNPTEERMLEWEKEDKEK